MGLELEAPSGSHSKIVVAGILISVIACFLVRPMSIEHPERKVTSKQFQWAAFGSTMGDVTSPSQSYEIPKT